MDTTLETVKSKDSSLSERVADQITRLIIEQHLVSGDKLDNEFDLAEQLNVGRGSVREAVKILVARNVLEIRRGKGTFIASNPGEVPDPLGFAFYPDRVRLAMDLLEVRCQMEPWVARMAAEKATKENLEELQRTCAAVEDDILNGRNHLENDKIFHTSIAKCTQNMAVPKLLPIITYAVTLFGDLTENKLKTETIIGHRAILDAICAGDGDAAAKAMEQHMEHNRVVLAEILKKLPEQNN